MTNGLSTGRGNRSRTRRAIVEPFDGDWYTQPREETEIYIERIEAKRDVLGVELHFGIVSVSEQVIAFQRKRIGDGHGDEAFDFVAVQDCGMIINKLGC